MECDPVRLKREPSDGSIRPEGRIAPRLSMEHPDAIGFAIRERFHEHCYDFIAAWNRLAMSPLSQLGHDSPFSPWLGRGPALHAP